MSEYTSLTSAVRGTTIKTRLYGPVTAERIGNERAIIDHRAEQLAPVVKVAAKVRTGRSNFGEIDRDLVEDYDRPSRRDHARFEVDGDEDEYDDRY